jgi:hypothetical protein
LLSTSVRRIEALTSECFESCGFKGLQPRNQGNGYPIITIPADRFWITEALTSGGQLLKTALCTIPDLRFSGSMNWRPVVNRELDWHFSGPPTDQTESGEIISDKAAS